MFHSDLLLRRRISFSPPQPPAAAVTITGDFPGSSSPAENHKFRSAEGRSTRRWPPRRKPASHAPSRACLLRQLAVHAPARECACGRVTPSPMTGLHSQGRPAPSWCSSPPAVHSEHFFSTFCPFLPPPSASVPLPWLRFISVAPVHLQSASVHLQSYSLQFGSPFSSSSSSTAVIRPLIRALFNPNAVQSPVQWIWQLKILFLRLLSLDLLLSHQKN